MADVKKINGYDIKDETARNQLLNMPKYKLKGYANLSNSSSTAYFITVSSDVESDIKDGDSSIIVNEVLSATLGDWASVGKVPVSISYDNNKLFLMFPKGTTFSGGGIRIRYLYR